MKKAALFVSCVFAVSLAWAGTAAAEERSGQGAYGTSGQAGQAGAAGQSERSQVGEQQAQAGEQQKGIQAASDIKGFAIQNNQGERLGEVSELLVDIEKGKIGYVVISSGGVLGMGEENYIVPFNALTFNEQQNALTLDMQKEQLQEAPQGDVAEALDQEQGRQIHQFYGVSPYWEEEGASQQQDPLEQQLQQQEQQELQQQQQVPQQERL
ncbi:MAG: PRC-barrel domain-containing protein [Desulfuromonadales bacterium]|nr:PRC-barrel domain-containing protein [Desulfuromonadales bacterium]